MRFLQRAHLILAGGSEQQRRGEALAVTAVLGNRATLQTVLVCAHVFGPQIFAVCPYVSGTAEFPNIAELLCQRFRPHGKAERTFEIAGRRDRGGKVVEDHNPRRIVVRRGELCLERDE